MRRSTSLYGIYVIVIIIVTAFFSFKIMKGEFQSIGFWYLKKYELSEPPNIIEGEKSRECPCKKVGLEYPNCGMIPAKESKNPLISNELIPGHEQIYDGAWICIPPTIVRINSHGFRDYEYSIEKSNNTFRIIVLGDSHTFGEGVELNDTYSKKLEKMLNDRSKDVSYEVLNFGVGGYNMLEKVEFFKEKGLKFNPNLIIIQFNSDDIVNWTELSKLHEEVNREYIQEHYLEDRSKLADEVLRQLEVKTWQLYDDVLEKRTFDEVFSIVEKPLTDLANITDHINVSVLLIYGEPCLSASPQQETSLRDLCKKFNWYILNFHFDEYNEDELIIHPKDCHPNPLMHELIAKEIYKKLFESRLLHSK